jgi:hypothetical protein
MFGRVTRERTGLVVVSSCFFRHGCRCKRKDFSGCYITFCVEVHQMDSCLGGVWGTVTTCSSLEKTVQ